MPFGALSSAQQILIKLYLRGGPQFRAELEKSGFAVKGLAASQAELSKQMAITTKRTFLHNQALFMARRGLFYATLGVVGLTASIVKMGFSYSSTMQQARVALSPVVKGTGELNKEMNTLFNIAAVTPFSFAQITSAFRIMYAGFEPLGVKIETVNDLLRGTTDILAYTGQLTPSSLKRVSNSLQDMANMGKLTGITMNSLARLGIPLPTILNKQLGIMGTQLQHISSLNISSDSVIQAIIDYSKSAPGVMNAALRQSNETLFGAWSTFKDLMSQAAGGAVGGVDQAGGMFGTIQKAIVGVNEQLAEFSKAGKPITLLAFADALDSQLTPSTHAITNLFIMFEAALKSLIGTFYVFFKILQIVLWPFNKLGNMFGFAGAGAKILGVGIGILTGVIIINKGILAAESLALEAVRVKQLLLRDAITQTTLAMKLQSLASGGFTGIGGFFKRGRAGTLGKAEQVVVGRTPAWKSASGMLEVEMGAAAATGAMGKFLKMLDTDKVGGFRNALKSLILNIREEGFAGSLSKLPALFGLFGTSLVASSKAIWSKMIPAMTALITESLGLEAANIWWAWIPLIIIAVAGALVLLYRKWDRFHYLVDDTFNFIKKHWKLLVWFVPIIGPIIMVMVQIIDHWKTFTGLIEDAIRKVVDLGKEISHIADKIPGWHWVRTHKGPTLAEVTGRAKNWLTTEDIAPRKRALGGPIFGAGPVLVGERGPEVVMLPGGANVIPNHAIGQVNPVGRGVRGDGEDRPILVQVMLDRKVLAEGVSRAYQDYAARR